MKKTFFSLFAILLCASVSAQQTASSGTLANFHSVELTGGVVAKLVPSTVNFVDISVTNADVSNLKWGVTSGVLSITFRQPSKKGAKAEVIIQYTDDLKSVSIVNGELSFDKLSATDVLDVKVRGGGVLTGSIDVLDLMLDITGNSAASLWGTAKYVAIHSNEKSKVDVRGIEAVSAEVDANTGSEIYVQTHERLVANAKTGATIFYKGTPPVVRDLSSKLSTTIGSSVLSIGK